MKIAITGHSEGIGQALAKIYEAKGHEIVGLSRRNGYNIRSLPKVADMIEPCDMFINNAQIGYAQTELLCEIWRRWKDQRKSIIVISTHLTCYPTSVLDGWEDYWLQKRTLEEACSQLRFKALLPEITVVKPGAVDTQLANGAANAANVDEWATTLVNILEIAKPNLSVPEIALTVNHNGL